MKITMTNGGGYADLLKNLSYLNEAKVKVGFPEGAAVGKSTRSGSGQKPYSDISEVARVAIWNEFGVPNKSGRGWKIPPRPFFRNALDTSKKTLPVFQDRILDAVRRGKMTGVQALDALGIFMSDKIKASIRATTTPPNAPRTIAEKGSSHPLIDTGQLINSVTYAKIKGGE